MVDAEDTFTKLALGEHHNAANIQRNIRFFFTINTSPIGEAQKKSDIWPKGKC